MTIFWNDVKNTKIYWKMQIFISLSNKKYWRGLGFLLLCALSSKCKERCASVSYGMSMKLWRFLVQSSRNVISKSLKVIARIGLVALLHPFMSQSCSFWTKVEIMVSTPYILVIVVNYTLCSMMTGIVMY